MDSTFLATYLAVVDSGSMAEASRRLDLAPTTVAQQVRALETELGSKLLVRSGRTVMPTVAGRRILERARLIVRSVADLQSDASHTELPAGPLRLGATPTGLMGILPPALLRWRNTHPDIGIAIEPGTSLVLLQRVVSGQLDAALIVHPTYALPKVCDWLRLRSEPLILLTPAHLEVTNPLETLMTHPYIRYDRNVVAGKMAEDYLRERGIKPQAQFELDGIEHIARLVAGGLGISILPDWPAAGPPDLTTTRWPLPPPRPSRTIGLAWHRASARAPLARVLADLLRPSYEGEDHARMAAG